MREMSKLVMPIIEYTRNGLECTSKVSAAGKEHCQKFTLGQEFDEVTPDGRSAKVQINIYISSVTEYKINNTLY